MTHRHFSRKPNAGLLLATALAAIPALAAGETPPGESLRQGLYAEEVKRDPDEAAEHYAGIIAAEDRRRATVATAIFRLAEVKRGQGKKDEAVALYQKLLREYPAADAEGKLAREILGRLGAKVAEPGEASQPDAETKQLETLRKMLDNSPDELRKPGYAADLFREAVVNDYPKVAGFLVDAGLSVANLTYPTERGRLKIVRLLLEKGGPEIRSDLDRAFLIAVASHKMEIVRVLGAAGADPGWQPEKWPVEYYVGDDRPRSAASPALHQAIQTDNAELVEFLLNNKADPKLAARGSGLTPLHMAVKWRTNAKLVTRLLDLGADVNALAAPSEPAKSRHPEPRSPLQAAVEEENWEIAGLLIARGADLNQPDLFAPFEPNAPPYDDNREKIARKIAFLLDAGAPVGGNLYPIIARVAPADTDGSRIRKMLANNPPPLDPTGIPDLSGWPEPACAAFLEAAVYPALAGMPGVKLLLGDSGVWKTVWEPERGGETPSAVELVWENRDWVVALPDRARQNREAFRNLKCVMIRPQPDGSCVEVEKDGGSDTLPRERDMIVIIRSDRGRVENDEAYREFGSQVIARLRQKVAFPVTLEIGGKERGIRVRGDRLVFDPTVPEAPLLNAASLARLFLTTTGGRDGGLNAKGGLRIRRKGWTDLAFDLNSAEARQFALRRGDKLVLTDIGDPEEPARPGDRDGGTVPYQAMLVTPGLPFARVMGIARSVSRGGMGDMRVEMPTLLEALADCYAGPGWQAGRDTSAPMLRGDKPKDFATADDQTLFRLLSDQTPAVVLPHPDFSAIRIRRVGKDGKETLVQVDLAAAINRCSDATDSGEARKSDLPLLPGDIVELPLKPVEGHPWSGLSEAEIRFFRKALARRILVNTDGRISTMELTYEPPRWRQTAFGLLPLPPAGGLSTFRLSAVDGILTRQEEEERRKQMERGGFGSGSVIYGMGSLRLTRGDKDLRDFNDARDLDPFVRDGDTVGPRDSGRFFAPGSTRQRP